MGRCILKCSGIDTAMNSPPSIQSVIRMFTDFGLLSRFDINYNTFCRWLLTVKKNYRQVAYHNWTHGFHVGNSVYSILKANPDVFKPLEVSSQTQTP